MNWSEVYVLLKIEEATRGHPQLAALKNLAYQQLLELNSDAQEEFAEQVERTAEIEAEAQAQKDAEDAQATEAEAIDETPLERVTESERRV